MTWTPRNSINVALAAALVLVICYVEFFDPNQRDLQSFAIAALAGLMIPGSPIGRGIDALLSAKSTPKATWSRRRLSTPTSIWTPRSATACRA